MNITADHKHNFRESTIKDYEVCIECGTYHSTNQVEPKVIYEDSPYWGDGTGRSTLSQQISNMTCTDECGISKVNRVLQFVPKGKSVLEVACAPSAMLSALIEYGYTDVWGIEPSASYIPFICEHAPQSKVIHGFFPQVTETIQDGYFDTIVALDVFEHTDLYQDFLFEVKRLLKDGGTAVIMSPIILDDGDGFVRKRDFEPSQHCWIHSEKYLKPYLQEMFTEVKFSTWICGHNLIILKK